jgi:Nif-specific regulatory protein
MRAIDEVSEALGRDAGLRQRLELALAVLERRLGLARSVIYAVHPRTRRIEIVAWHGLSAAHYRPRFGAGVVGRAAQSQQRIVVPEVRLEPMALSELSNPEDWAEEGWSLAALPLLAGKALTGVLAGYALGGPGAPIAASPELSSVAALLASTLERALAPEPSPESGEAPRARARDAVFEYANLVGASPAMRLIYEEIAQVARTNATTLIRGESGTGKELVACAIHNNSERAPHPLIKVNCAALPEPLFESELFGHERGAYTGAHARRRGRFELADQGTLFLDEIGEISPAMQAKLLRVLQAREFERVGGSETLRTNVRIIAATNRNLEERVKTGAFRQDLYYRLNVFSITVPPLRGRRADIWALAEYFVGKYVAEHRRSVTGISNGALDVLSEYSWPGNVRELENAIERAVVVCDGFVIQPHHLPAALREPDSHDPALRAPLTYAPVALHPPLATPLELTRAAAAGDADAGGLGAMGVPPANVARRGPAGEFPAAATSAATAPITTIGESSTPPKTLREAVAALETRMLAEALTRARGNCARAARELGITERVVRYKAAQYNIDVENLRNGS